MAEEEGSNPSSRMVSSSAGSATDESQESASSLRFFPEMNPLIASRLATSTIDLVSTHEGQRSRHFLLGGSKEDRTNKFVHPC